MSPPYGSIDKHSLAAIDMALRTGVVVRARDTHADTETVRVEAYKAMFEDCYGRVYAFCARRVPAGVEADDVVAETFRTAWRRFGDIPQGKTLSWLLGTARRVLANEARSERRRRALTDRVRAAHVDHPAADAMGDNDDARLDVLAAALETLGERDVEILTLKEWDDLPHREISRILGIAEPTVAVRLHRARKRLRVAYDMVAARGTTLSAGSGGGT